MQNNYQLNKLVTTSYNLLICSFEVVYLFKCLLILLIINSTLLGAVNLIVGILPIDIKAKESLRIHDLKKMACYTKKRKARIKKRKRGWIAGPMESYWSVKDDSRTRYSPIFPDFLENIIISLLRKIRIKKSVANVVF